jgi:hypothetical protein
VKHTMDDTTGFDDPPEHDCTYITPEAYNAAAELHEAALELGRQLRQNLSLADKVAIKRDMKRLQNARRIVLGVI